MEALDRRTHDGDRRPLRILFVTPYVPSLLRARSFNLIKHLCADGHRLTVLAVRSTAEDEHDAALLAPYCERVETVHVPFGRSLWNCVRGAYRRLPLQALYCDSPSMRIHVAAALNGALGPVGHNGSARDALYDIMHVEHLRAVLFGVGLGGVPRVYDSVDCISRLFEKTVQMGAKTVSTVFLQFP